MKEQLEIFYKTFNTIPEKDVEDFKRLVNKLINVNYLTAFKVEDKKDYYFICNYIDSFKSYFQIGGRELVHYSNQRTLVLQSDNSPKISLNKMTSIIILILRLLYTQKIHDLSLDNQIITTTGEIQEKFVQLALSANERIKSNELYEGLKLLKRHNIIDYKGNDFQSDDFVLIIYPTIQYAVSLNDINMIINKINSYKSMEEDYEEIEEN